MSAQTLPSLRRPVKTSAGRRDLPLLDIARQALKLQAERQAAYRADMGSAGQQQTLYSPPEPAARSSRGTSSGPSGRICEDNNIRVIKVHHVRHTVGSLLEDLRIPARDVQASLGHGRISTTLEILHRHRRSGPPRGTYPAARAARRRPELSSLLHAMATNGPLSILIRDVLPGGASESRTCDPLLAKSAQLAAYRG